MLRMFFCWEIKKWCVGRYISWLEKDLLDYPGDTRTLYYLGYAHFDIYNQGRQSPGGKVDIQYHLKQGIRFDQLLFYWLLFETFPATDCVCFSAIFSCGLKMLAGMKRNCGLLSLK